MSADLSKSARLARNESTAALMRGGSIRLYDGPPASANDPIVDEMELVRVDVPDSRIAVRAESGCVICRGMRRTMVAREGVPTFWRGVSRFGAVVACGEVTSGAPARALLKSNGPQQAMLVEVDKLWRGMEFELPELKITIGAAA